MPDSNIAVSDGAVFNEKPTASFSTLHEESWQFQATNKKVQNNEAKCGSFLEFDDNIYKCRLDSGSSLNSGIDSRSGSDSSHGLRPLEAGAGANTRLLVKDSKLSDKKLSEKDVVDNKKLSADDIIRMKEKLAAARELSKHKGLEGKPVVGVKEPIKESVKESVKEPVKEPIKEPLKEPIKQPIKETIKQPLKETTNEPINEKLYPKKDMAAVERQNVIDRRKFEQSMTPEQLKKIEEMKKSQKSKF